MYIYVCVLKNKEKQQTNGSTQNFEGVLCDWGSRNPAVISRDLEICVQNIFFLRSCTGRRRRRWLCCCWLYLFLRVEVEKKNIKSKIIKIKIKMVKEPRLVYLLLVKIVSCG